MRVHHIEWLVTGLCMGLLAIVPRVFWPTEPPIIWRVEIGLGLIAALMLLRAVDRRPTWAPEGKGRRLLWRLLQLVCALSFILFLGPVFLWMHASGFMVATMVSSTLGIALGAAEVTVLALCVWQGFRVAERRPMAQIVASIAFFLGCFQFVVWAIWMWSPPSAETCRAVDLAGHVTRLSPAEWAGEASQPYDLLYIEEERWLMGSFKMAGNGGVPFLDSEESNRILGIDTVDPRRSFVVPFVGRELPQYMTYNPETRELLVSRLGGISSWLDVINLSALPEAQVARSIKVPYSTHAVVTHPTRPVFGVFSDIGDFMVMAQETFEVVSALNLHRPGNQGPLTMHAWHRSGTPKVYVSSLFYPLAEIDMDTQEVRWTGPLFGGGQLTGDLATERVFQTDILFHRVDIIGMRSLELESRLELDYAPRPVVVDSTRDLLIVGGWLDGVVRFYRLSDLTLRAEQAYVGPYLRDLAYDAKHGTLFAASQCGIYQVDLPAVLGPSF